MLKLTHTNWKFSLEGHIPHGPHERLCLLGYMYYTLLSDFKWNSFLWRLHLRFFLSQYDSPESSIWKNSYTHCKRFYYIFDFGRFHLVISICRVILHFNLEDLFVRLYVKAVSDKFCQRSSVCKVWHYRLCVWWALLEARNSALKICLEHFIKKLYVEAIYGRVSASRFYI